MDRKKAMFVKKTNMIKIGVFIEHDLLRDSIVELTKLLKKSNVEVATFCRKELIEKLNTIKIDLVIVDLENDYKLGVELIQAIKNTNKNIKTIGLINSISRLTIVDLVKSNANSLLNKDMNLQTLEEAIKKTTVNLSFFDVSLYRTFSIDDFEYTKQIIQNYNFTEKELIIYNLIEENKNLNDEIRKLGISQHTLKMYLKKIDKKTKRYNKFKFKLNHFLFFNKIYKSCT